MYVYLYENAVAQRQSSSLHSILLLLRAAIILTMGPMIRLHSSLSR